ncbi:MAG: response regulator, partial [Bacteriovoracaceae bacterium]|nr:response regulator [Bacteriovoracaceae bacterium]
SLCPKARAKHHSSKRINMSTEQPSTLPSSPKKILLIEDELLIQKSLKILMERQGAIVDAVSSGREAIKLIAQESYHKIICDLMLQDISGMDVLEEAKKTYPLIEMGRHFIIITAYSSPQVLNKAKEYGCQVISKPFQNLEVVIAQFLR